MSATRDREDLDLIVVGGGIAGVGILQAAAAAGYRALLLEQKHIAFGTSRWSSKLIHGGLRYLESAQFGLVRESLRERATLLEIAPDLVRLVPFYIPIYRDTSRRPWQIRAGLSLYALLGGLQEEARFEKVPKSKWGELDGLKTGGLQAVYRYHDGQTDDAALTRAVLRSAESLGAQAITSAEFRGAVKSGDGWNVSWVTGDVAYERRAHALVNAAGPWVNSVRDGIEPKPPGFEVDFVQGAHIELEGEAATGIFYTEAPRDGRAVFSIPWKGHTMVGTTETLYTGDPAEAHALDEEVEYLLQTYAHYFPGKPQKVIDRWAGLRVLPRREGSAFSRPRDVTLVVDEKREPRLVSVYGGKLTGYRATAEKVMKILIPTLGDRPRLGDTKKLPLTPEPA